MIPKIIHYCWFGGKPLSNEAKRCISSWKINCPEYKVIKWDESNFNISMNVYVEEAYKKKKWAFVSDYVRLVVLKKYGGIYLDTDVEMIKPLDKLLLSKAFMGAESKYSICTAVIGAEKNSEFINELLTIYDELHFINNQKLDMTPNSQRIYEYLKQNYNYVLSNDVIDLKKCIIYPKDFFSPINCYTFIEEETQNTYCIHRFAGTWKSKNELLINKAKAFITRFVGEDFRKKVKTTMERRGKKNI